MLLYPRLPRAILRNSLIGLAGFVAGMLIAALAAVPAWSAEPQGGTKQQRSSELIVYGNDPCPKGTDGEIVVCSRQPENERYRVPKRFREEKAKASPASNAWSNKAATLDEAGRVAAGVPDTCSAVGSGGQTGCYRAFLAQARAQRKADQAEAATVP